MKRLLLALAMIATPAFGAADLFLTQTNELSQSSFARLYGSTVATDNAEAGSTRQVIVATAHVALPGDMIRFTTPGPNYLLEAHVRSVLPNSITLQRALPADPGVGDTFLIMRLLTPALAADGSSVVSGTVSASNPSVAPTGGAPPASATYPGYNNAGVFTGVSVANPLPVTATVVPVSHAFADSSRYDYTGVPVTVGAWVQLIASTAAASTLFTLFDSSGQTLELGKGAAGFETRISIIPPGGFDGQLALNIAAGTRIAIRSISATANTGELDLTLFQ